MSRRSPKPPEEDPSVGIARQRQFEELADLDEEENRRIKAALNAARGVRAFRGRGSGVSSAAIGSTGGGAQSAASSRAFGRRGSIR